MKQAKQAFKEIQITHSTEEMKEYFKKIKEKRDLKKEQKKGKGTGISKIFMRVAATGSGVFPKLSTQATF